MVKENKNYKFVEKKLSPLWRLGKTLYVFYQLSNNKSKELLKVDCVKDERGDEYFYFEKFNYNFHRRLFNKTKWCVMTKVYSERTATYQIEDLINYGKLHLEEVVKASKILKDLGVDVPILENKLNERISLK